MNQIEKAQAIHDAEYCGAYLDGEKKGIVEGIASGIAEGIAKVAKAMLQYGDPPEKIAGLTGLSLDQVRGLC